MLPWWKRLLYSFLSVLFGGSVVGMAASLLGSGAHVDFGRLLISTCIVVIASLSGWLAAIPIVLLVRDYRGWLPLVLGSGRVLYRSERCLWLRSVRLSD